MRVEGAADRDRHPWGVTYNRELAEAVLAEYEHVQPDLRQLDREMREMYAENVVTEEERSRRRRIIAWLQGKLNRVHPNGYLVCGGSTVSGCGTLESDMDLCYVLRTADSYADLPIEMYREPEVNHFILNRVAVALRDEEGVSKLKLVDATVPIVKMELDTGVLGEQPPRTMEVDINCNCVAGVYNSFLLGGLANYALVLLVVHYLQCGVSPPVLPNLMQLLPPQFNGDLEPSQLSTDISCIEEQHLRLRKNTMSCAQLALGFLRYYSRFSLAGTGMSVKEGRALPMADVLRRVGHRSRVFVEEPYDEITVPKNLRDERDINHITEEFRLMAQQLAESPSLATLHGRLNPSRNKRQRLREEGLFNGEEEQQEEDNNIPEL